MLDVDEELAEVDADAVEAVFGVADLFVCAMDGVEEVFVVMNAE